MAMLRRNPGLAVFAVHDASPEGCALPHVLRGDAWFPDPSITVVDLGLRPGDAARLRLLTLERPGPGAPDQVAGKLSSADLDWLRAGNVCELEVLRPADLIRGVYQGMNIWRTTGSRGGDAESDGWIAVDGDGDAPDSFG